MSASHPELQDGWAPDLLECLWLAGEPEKGYTTCWAWEASGVMALGSAAVVFLPGFFPVMPSSVYVFLLGEA